MTEIGLPEEMPDGVFRVGITFRTIRTTCEGPGCTVVIEQPQRPGRRRRFHSDACRKRAKRAQLRKPTPEFSAWIRALQEMSQDGVSEQGGSDR